MSDRKNDMEEGEVRGPEVDWPEPKKPLGAFVLEKLYGFGDRIIQIYPNEGVQWKAVDLAKRAESVAFAMAEDLGIKQGDRVCFITACHPDFAPFMLATWLLGATFSPLNPGFDEGDMERILRIVQPTAIFCKPSAIKTAQTAASRAVPNASLLELDQGNAWQKFQKCAAVTRSTPFKQVEVGDLHKSIAALMCSSGTTGLPKCVIYTQFMIHCSQNILVYKDGIVQPDHKVILTAPGFWLTGLFYNTYSMAYGTQVIFKFGSSEEEFLDSIGKLSISTLFTSSNFLVAVAKAYEANPSYNLSTLHTVICGGTAMGRQSQEYVEKVLGKPANQAYGMTELNCGIGFIVSQKKKQGSVGLLCPTLRCKIVHPVSGKTMGRNEAGELRFKSPCITPGYYNNPESTADLLDEKGWLKTGDIGYVDEDGYFYISGRTKDIIKYKGDHVSPAELEGVLNEHPAVLESAVVGVPHPTLQELPRAYVVLRPGAKTDEKELAGLVEAQLADHKHLRGGVHFVDSLPKTASGKINHTELRKKYGLDDPSKFGV